MFGLPRPKIVLLVMLAWLVVFPILVVTTKVEASFGQLVIGALSLPIYLLPTAVAYLRHHHNALAICVLNLIFGVMAAIQLAVGAFWGHTFV